MSAESLESTVQSVAPWSHMDELKLLDAINICGFGNWLDISQKVPPHSAADCEKHYFYTFSQDFEDCRRGDALCSNNCKIKVDSKVEHLSSYLEVSELNAYIKNLEKCETSNTFSTINVQNRFDGVRSNCNKMYMLALPTIGYNRIRSDFDIEYDNGAEMVLKMISENHCVQSEMDEDESTLLYEMEYVLCQSYNSRLKERRKRKQTVKNHCLLDRRKSFTMLQRLDVPFGKTTFKALIPFMRFLNGPQFDFLVERMKYQNELKLKMHLYIEYRNNGLKFVNEIDMYKHLKNKRLKYNTELASLQVAPNSDPRISTIQYNRKPVTPLALGHLPGYNLLNEDEKKLCSTARIVPETYNTFKEVLMAECEKYNGLRLAQARNLIKIDVNKTRKIYDYLMSVNLIWLPQS